MGRLVSIDPGACTGVAIFEDSNLVQAYATRDIRPLKGFDECVCEIPVIYPVGKGKGNPNALVQVALRAGILTALMTTTYVTPSKWKSTVKKEIMCRRIETFLRPEEHALIPDLPRTTLHNVLDAIGIGLWHLGRMGRGGVTV
jgi:hypothetical protein